MKSLTEYFSESEKIVSLKTYLNESLLNEAFFDYDTALADVPEKKQDVEKLKVLIKKFTKFGEEENYEEDNAPYERLLNSLKNNCTENQFKKLEEIKSSVRYNDPYEIKLAARSKYCDKMFSLIKNICDKENARGWGDYNYLITALVGCADYIENYSSMKSDDADKYLGKLANKFNNVFGVDADGFTKISKMYNSQKVSIQQALDIEAKTVESVKAIKDDFKNHKYTIFADSHDSAAEIYIIENTDFENLDDAFTETVAKEIEGSPVYGYDLDKKLRELVNNGKVSGLFLCSGCYSWGENKDDIIPTFGYLDRDIAGQEIYKYSGYDKKYYYCGKIPEQKRIHMKDQKPTYQWYDSLWSSHTKE